MIKNIILIITILLSILLLPGIVLYGMYVFLSTVFFNLDLMQQNKIRQYLKEQYPAKWNYIILLNAVIYFLIFILI
jgi:hypothetical protein